jgi:hypothetical protein
MVEDLAGCVLQEQPFHYNPVKAAANVPAPLSPPRVAGANISPIA